MLLAARLSRHTEDGEREARAGYRAAEGSERVKRLCAIRRGSEKRGGRKMLNTYTWHWYACAVLRIGARSECTEVEGVN